jgi:rhodanese-related sulfurtransferase
VGIPGQSHPGSLHLDTIEKGLEALDANDEIVVYCSNPDCVASVAAFRMLADDGYAKVWRYAGGLEDWKGTGYPLEGEMA